MKTIRICCGTGCLANGSAKVAEEFERLTAGADGIRVECDIKRTGCNGFCENGPLVTILPDEISYYHVKVSDVKEILEKTILNGELVNRLLKKINPVEDFKALVIAGTYAEDHKILYCLMGIEDFDLLVLYLEISNVFNLREEEILCAPCGIEGF